MAWGGLDLCGMVVSPLRVFVGGTLDRLAGAIAAIAGRATCGNPVSPDVVDDFLGVFPCTIV